MDTKALKQKILDLAIRGKLVPQDPNDEPASVLLEKIRAEKQQMVKDGKLKSKELKNDSVIFVGEDNLHYEKFNDGSIECIENEIPFALPKGWKWTRFGNIIKLMSGTSYPIEQEKREGKKLYVKVGDMNLPENSFEIVASMQYLDDYSSSHLVPRNSVIFPKRGGAIATNKKKLVLREEIIVDLNTMAFTPISPVYLMYCYYWFLSIDISEINTGTSIPQINNKDINPLLFPLPPVKEQYRIASTIGTLLSRIDSINKNKAELSQLIEQTKTKILDLAIRGKLVPQDPNDEPASVLLEHIHKEKDELIKAGKLKRDKRESVIFRGEDNSYYEKFSDGTVECIREEIPFAIPKNWNWVRLENICYNIYAGGDKPSDFVKEKDAEHSIPVVANGTTNEGIMGFTKTPTAQANTITIAGRGTIGFPVYRNYEYCPIVRLLVINQCNLINPLFLYYYLYARRLDSVGSSIPQLTVPMVKPKLIPLPPLKEQQNIVNRIIELLSVIESIDANLM